MPVRAGCIILNHVQNGGKKKVAMKPIMGTRNERVWIDKTARKNGKNHRLRMIGNIYSKG
jgi:hypothetical protein